MCIEKKSLLNVVATTMGTIFFENAIIETEKIIKPHA